VPSPGGLESDLFHNQLSFIFSAVEVYNNKSGLKKCGIVEPVFMNQCGAGALIITFLIHNSSIVGI
jgi:hypothetical protein